ncbi:MAG: DNA-formamidopyrimidine glycosylase family protein [Candidatus Saccharibacteria bacterium]|nr:DNA-formamidopyrimidine glycosylase family protein [Candidatus Saccharibacteria bacterium]
MPELPEVETVRRGLSELIVGKRVAAVWHDWAKSFPNAESDVEQFLIGACVTAVKRRAKVLLIELDSQYSLVCHLKMTGQMVYVKRQASSVKRQEERFGAGHPNSSLVDRLPDKSTRVILCLQGRDDALESNVRKLRSTEEVVHDVRRLSTGAVDTAVGQEHWQDFWLGQKAQQCGAHLFFNDQRKFGWVKLIPTIEVPNIDFMKKVGPEPLETSFTADQFIERLQRRKNTNIKAAILDQTVLAGVGNIYADESLWGAKINPKTLVKNVPAAKLNTLFQELRYVLELAIEKGGSTDKDYVSAEGKRGSYLSFARVFRREGQQCPRHPGIFIQKIRVAGRGTHICTKCQKE